MWPVSCSPFPGSEVVGREVCVYACVCMVGCPVLMDSKPCETPPLDVIPGCSKCLFLCEVGEWARAGCWSFCGWFTWWAETAAEPKTCLGESTALELASRLRRHLHFCLFLTKKKDGLAVRGRGNTQPLMPKRSLWTQTLLWCDFSPG